MIPSILPTYNRAPMSFVRGEGAWLIDEDGDRYLDLGAGIAVNALGHANPDLVAALKKLTGDIEDVKIARAGGYLVAQFRHQTPGKNAKKWFDAVTESDGT